MRYLLRIAAVIALLVTLPALAWAGETQSHEGGGTTTTTTTVLFAPGLALALPVLTTTGGMSTSASSMTATTMTTTRKLWRNGLATVEVTTYLRDNHRDLREGVLMGGGEAMDDLAHLLEIPKDEYEQFAKEVRANRDELLPHLHESLDREDATAFLLSLMEATS